MIKHYIKNLSQRFKQFEESRTGKRVIRLLTFAMTATIIAYLVYKLTLIGWHQVWTSLPRTPWFYLLLFAIFFALPVFQVFIYRVAWHTYTHTWGLFLALLKKRVFDKDVLGYSGEMYLYLWARKNVSKSDKEIALVLKDNIILSSTASTLVAVVLLVLFFVLGRVSLPAQWAHPGVVQIAVIAFCIILVVGLAITFRRNIFFLGSKEVVKIFLLHIARLLVVQGLQILQWMVVMPEIPITNWFTLLATQIIITRIPLLPSRDLIFMGTGIEMSHLITVSTTSMAGMLLASTVIGKLANLTLFSLMFLFQRNRPSRSPKGELSDASTE